MYKVFFNDSFFIITQNPETELHRNIEIKSINDYKQIVAWLLELEKSKKTSCCIFSCVDPDNIWNDLYTNMKIIPAAGGLVKNDIGKYLFIFRRGKWDLPKGKIDKGEGIKEAAIREVKEETGLTNIYITGDCVVTYHIYRYKGTLALKPTHWHQMVNLGDNKLIPQTSEDIEKAEWLNSDEIPEIKKNIFGTILDVIDFFKI